MKIRQLHHWNVSFRQAIEIQRSLRHQLIFKEIRDKIRLVAGTDVSTTKESDTIWAGAVVLKYPSLEKIEEKWVKGTTSFPYVPGLLSFREAPLVLKALDSLKQEPDVVLCDGQGIAHPRGLGLASHLGVLIDRPTIGCAKKRLVGTFSEVGLNKGDSSRLLYKGKEVGVVLRTRTSVKPLFISPGHNITIKDCSSIVLDCVSRYRIPEPIRQAHLLVNQIRSH